MAGAAIPPRFRSAIISAHDSSYSTSPSAIFTSGSWLLVTSHFACINEVQSQLSLRSSPRLDQIIDLADSHISRKLLDSTMADLNSAGKTPVQGSKNPQLVPTHCRLATLPGVTRLSKDREKEVPFTRLQTQTGPAASSEIPGSHRSRKLKCVNQQRVVDEEMFRRIYRSRCHWSEALEDSLLQAW